MKRIYLKGLLLCVFLYISMVSFSQIRGISGTVRSTNNEPIAGAIVSVLGTDQMSLTNEGGEFSVQAKSGDSIRVASMNYVSQVYILRDETNLSVILSDAAEGELDEVVVIGYGQTTRKVLTTAQATVSAKDIQRTVNTTFDQALQGRVAGVQVVTNSAQPGGGMSINIRGVSTLTGTQNPLYVIDGQQVQPEESGFSSSGRSSTNPLAFLNPNDIESLEVLQGPSATAIYGSRATNGVIIVTTKRGKKGDTKVTYDFLYTLQGIPPKIPVLDLKEYTILNNELKRYQNGGNDISIFQGDSSILGKGTNWQDELFKRAPLSRHQVSLSGGSDNNQYYLSMERFDQEGVVRGSSFNRTSARLNLDSKIKTWMRMGFNITANQTNDVFAASSGTRAIVNAINLPPFIPARNPDGSYGGYPDSLSEHMQDNLNPLAVTELMTNTLKRNRVDGGVNLVVDILKGLQFRTLLNIGLNNSNGVDFRPTYKIGGIVNNVNTLDESVGNGMYWNWSQTLDYNLIVREHHKINVMFTHEAMESTWKGMSAYRANFPSNELPLFGKDKLPSLVLGDANTMRNSGYKGSTAQESYLGRINYGYKNKYLLNLTYRTDGSPYFGYENRWGSFPSLSAAWRMSEEKFFQPLKPVVNEFKIRYETGYTGNQGNGSGVFAPLVPISTVWGTGFKVGRYDNPFLQWEETMTHNFGFNLGLWKDRITLDGDFYYRYTENLLLENTLLPWYMGTSGAGAILPPYINLGTMSNRGWAFNLNTVNIENKDLRWTTNFNISHNKNKIEKFYNETQFVSRQGYYGGPTQRSEAGHSAWLFWGYRYDGLFRSMDEVNAGPWVESGTIGTPVGIGRNGIWIGDIRYKNLDNDTLNLINTRDMTYIGNPYPDFTFGFTNDITWNNFNLSMLITGSIGNDIYNQFRLLNSQIGKVYSNQGAMDYVKDYARIGFNADGTPYLINQDAKVPRLMGGNGNFGRSVDYYIEDGSYARIKNLTIAYILPASVLQRIKVVQGLKLSFGVQNLYTLTKYSGFDPEIGADIGANSSPSTRTFGMDWGQYPQTRSYNFNLSINL